jgi:glutathione synthase/RimK-type ligase-like ATP-grasp enzyme
VTGAILMWGLLEDPTMSAVHDWLARLGARVVFVNHADIGETRVDVTTAPQVSHRLVHHDYAWPLEEFSAAYLRPHDARDYVTEAAAADIVRTSRVHHLISDWAEYSPAFVVNRPSGEGSNHSKLRQAMEIRAGGFETPRSLVTNEPARIVNFCNCNGSVVYKSLSGVRSLVKELDIDQIPAGPMGPVLVQQRILGTNLRVHVVGDRTFGARIETDAIDYRYAPSRVVPFTPHDDLSGRCVALTRRLGLVVSGIDLIETAAGDWYCLEVNPNPGFTFYDRSDEQVVARAIAELLMRGADAFTR